MLSFSPRALRELDAILSYISKDSRTGADHVRERVLQVADYICAYPLAGRKTGHHGIRVCTVPPYPYLIFYKVIHGSGDVRILRVRHAARKSPYFNEEPRVFLR